jgi:signal transduction histidine kinase
MAGARRGGGRAQRIRSSDRARSGDAPPERLPPRSRAEPAGAASAPPPLSGRELRAKYRDLAEKYRAMARRLGAGGTGIDFVRLSSWAMRLPSSGLVLVRKGVIAVSNVAFNNLCRVARGPLVRDRLDVRGDLGAADQRRFRTLREIASVEAAALASASARVPASRRYRALGAERWIEVIFDRVTAGLGSPTVVAMFHDVTARVKAEAALVAAHEVLARQQEMQAMGELAAGIVHDVSNTMAAIRLRLSALRRDPTCMAAQGPNIDALDRILSEGSELLRKLQNLGQRDEDRPPELVDVRECVAAAIEIAQSGLRYRAIHDGIDIRIENAVPALPTIHGWRDDLQRVFVNLLINARDAMPLGGLIRVRGAAAGREIVVEVEDGGTGIPPSVMPRIFEPYFTTKGASGTGMGLAMVQRAMARHAGSIGARNRNGGGAVFTLRFPVAAARAASTAAPASAASHLPNLPD